MIATTDLSFRYGDREVLSNVTSTMKRGELFGILGPNGSGKTTLLRLILALLPPSAGLVRVLGKPVASYGRRELARHLAAVPQETPIDFPFTAWELVMMGRLGRLGPLGIESAKDEVAARKALQACGANDFAARPIHKLSGGELRRVFIARALCQEADALCLDEPTSGLDIHHQVAIMELLKHEASSGKAVIAVLHDLNLAAAYCDRLLLLKDGKPMAQGTIEEVLTYRRVKECYGVEVYVGVNEVTGSRFLIPMR